jgi:D-sedoheptulose 7-phosphate isomerase
MLREWERPLTKNLQRSAYMDYITRYLDEVGQVLRALPHDEMNHAIDILNQARRDGKQIFVMGNGGSAAMASHFACDLGKGTVEEDKPRFRILSLNDNIPLLTAYGNDFGYEVVFAEPLASLAQPGDVAIAISSSGNSPNVLLAMDKAAEIGLTTIGITGYQGGKLRDKVDVCVAVPADAQHPDSMQHVEDGQWVILHAIFVTIRQGVK